MKQSDALRRLRRMVAADDEPTLTDDDLLDLLHDARVRDVEGRMYTDEVEWEPNAYHAIGAVVNGGESRFRATTAGSTGDLAPAWPAHLGDTITDGDVTWERIGAVVWTPTYDLNRAAVQGWELKAGLAASRVDYDADGSSVTRSQYLKHCAAMKQMYAQRCNYSVSTRPREARWRYVDRR